jgi:hypothetical protein
MKRAFLFVAILALTFPALRKADAGADVSVDFFYDNMGAEGEWVELEDYGYCWQPAVVVGNPRWRPYADGYWAFTDVGWTWVSNEDFGWATYHYGRWVSLRDRGWFWVPGREWGPAWVSWRTGGDYVGWAPLPPRGRDEVVYEAAPIGGQVDLEFDIGPAYYNFIELRFFGDPFLRERIFEPSVNVTYITQTVNVTNITYVNSVVHNYGPDYDRVNQYSTRPIRRMTLERDPNGGLTAGVRPNQITRVQGDKLIVASPLKIQKSAVPVAPKTLKERIEKPKFEHGWGTVPDPKTQAELKQKMKSEDPKKIPPPSVKPDSNPALMQSPGSISATPTGPTKPVLPGPQTSPFRTSIQKATPSGLVPPGRTPNVDAGPKAFPPPTRVAPTKPQTPDEVIPKQDVPGDTRPKAVAPPERMVPPNRQSVPTYPPKQTLPTERVAPPGQFAPAEIHPKPRPMPPERVAPPKAEIPRDKPVERVVPPKREIPSQPPPVRVAPPGGPKPEVPRSNRPPPTPVPGS